MPKTDCCKRTISLSKVVMLNGPQGDYYVCKPGFGCKKETLVPDKLIDALTGLENQLNQLRGFYDSLVIPTRELIKKDLTITINLEHETFKTAAEKIEERLSLLNKAEAAHEAINKQGKEMALSIRIIKSIARTRLAARK